MMKYKSALNVLFLTVLSGAVIFATVNAGKKVLVKIHVPKLINHKHHTNLVVVHKHHDHGNHKKFGGRDPVQSNHHSHGYGGHHSYIYGEPHTHSHSYGHRHRYSFSYGDGTGDKPTYSGGVRVSHKPKSHPAHLKVEVKVNKGNQGYKPKDRRSKISHGVKHSTNGQENNLPLNFNSPNTKSEHFSYVTYSPSFRIDDDNKLKKLNQTIRHEHTKVETAGDFHPDEENFDDVLQTRTRGSYEVQEDQPYDFYSQEHDVDFGEQISSKYSSNNPDEQAEKTDNYSEDYTNPNSVLKYTSTLQHGAITLEDSSYNPERGNDLEEYINKYKNSYYEF